VIFIYRRTKGHKKSEEGRGLGRFRMVRGLKAVLGPGLGLMEKARSMAMEPQRSNMRKQKTEEGKDEGNGRRMIGKGMKTG
jgi:hypothetical protein